VIEIELKAWIEDPQKTKAIISDLAVFKHDFEKEDAYWYPIKQDPPHFGVRVRKETNGDETHTLVTFKVKEKQGSVEVNDEKEFEASDSEPLETLLNLLGFQVRARKHKKGWAWTSGLIRQDSSLIRQDSGLIQQDSGLIQQDSGDITVELCEVHGLGWFVELEILALSADERTVEDARTRLLAFLKEIRVGEDKIESRYYTEMLHHLNKEE
jgi:adenylate cyclase class 2